MKNKATKFALIIIILILNTVSMSAVHNVTISSNSFSPSVLNIEAGDTVIFTNTSGFHNVKADDGSFRCSTDCEVTPGDSAGAPSADAFVAEITFNSVGSFNYFCEIHGGVGGSGMSGVINVAFPTSTTVHEVRTDGVNFVPPDLTIETGDIVNFINDGGTHNILADDGSFKCSDGCSGTGKNLSSAPSSNNWNFFLPFNEVGENPYFCELHGASGGTDMSGTVRVTLSNLIFTNGFEAPER